MLLFLWVKLTLINYWYPRCFIYITGRRMSISNYRVTFGKLRN